MYDTGVRGETDCLCLSHPDPQASGSRQTINIVALLQDGACAEKVDASRGLCCVWIAWITNSVRGDAGE